jgi:hypothetical protein
MFLPNTRNSIDLNKKSNSHHKLDFQRSSTNSSKAVVKCVCVCVCVCVRRRAALGVAGLCYIYIYTSCCVQIMYNFHKILYPLMHFSVQKSMDLWLRKIYYLNPELWTSKCFIEGLSKYLWFTALIKILTIINSKERNTPIMTSIKFEITTGLVK